MVALNDNTILVIGGEDGGRFKGFGRNITVYASCEIFNLTTRSWTPTGAMATPRYLHRATLLPNGKVLVAGGFTSPTGNENGTTASTEIYDPATRSWSPAATMPVARAIMEMITLPNGTAPQTLWG